MVAPSSSNIGLDIKNGAASVGTISTMHTKLLPAIPSGAKNVYSTSVIPPAVDALRFRNPRTGTGRIPILSQYSTKMFHLGRPQTQREH